MKNFNCFFIVDSRATYLAYEVDVAFIDFMWPVNSNDQRPIGPNPLFWIARNIAPYILQALMHLIDAIFEQEYALKKWIQE